MMAIRWLEAHIGEKNRREATTKEYLEELNRLKVLNSFETMCKVLNIPMEMRKIWNSRRLMPWFRVNMTEWLYEYGKNHTSKHSRVYGSFQLDIVPETLKRAFVTHRKAANSALKRPVRTID